ncbi:MAG: hypothetical protein V3V59_08385 [Thermodesulfovibrionales bacterium]
MRLFELKRTLKKKLVDNDLDSIAELAKQDRRVINILMSFSYDKETELSWRAIKAVGVSAEVLLESDYEFLRDTTRRLIWSVTEESGNVAWSSVEMLSEIVSSDLSRFYDLVPIIVSMYEEEIFREGVMYGLSRFAERSPDLVFLYEQVVHEALVDENARVKYYAVMSSKTARMDLPDDIMKTLKADGSVARIYSSDSIKDITISSLF